MTDKQIEQWLIELQREYRNAMFSYEAEGNYIKALQYENWIALLDIILNKLK